MPKSDMDAHLDELIETYVHFRTTEYGLAPAMAVREIALHRMGIESKRTPLQAWSRFHQLSAWCEHTRDEIQVIDRLIIEACLKFGPEKQLTADIYLSRGIVTKINAFSLEEMHCHKNGRSLTLKLDMISMRWLSDAAFTSLMYCIRQFEPVLIFSHLFYSQKNSRQKQLIENLPPGLIIRIKSLKSAQLLVDDKAMLFNLFESAAGISLVHCQLGRWTTEDIESLLTVLFNNQYLQQLDLRDNQLFLWGSPRYPEKFTALQNLFQLPFLKNINLQKNFLNKLNSEARKCLRAAIQAGMAEGLSQVSVAKCLLPKKKTARMPQVFFSTSEPNSSEQVSQCSDASEKALS